MNWNYWSRKTILSGRFINGPNCRASPLCCRNRRIITPPELGLENYAFSQSPLITDFNNDGKPDVFWVDMEGVGRAFINRTPNNFITLLFPDTVYSIGAKAYAITSDGKSYTREVHNNIGLSTDQISALTFGLGKKTAVEKVVIEWPDGKTRTFDNPPINQLFA